MIVGPLEVNCWLVWGDDESNAVVIDPGEDAEKIRGALGDSPVSAIVLTHAHFDHVGAVAELMTSYNAPLMIHRDDAARLASDGDEGTGGAIFGFAVTAPAATRLLDDGDVIEAAGVTLEVLHTPGHSAGSVCLLLKAEAGEADQLFSGDTLFAGSVGRTDFWGGDARAMSRSIATKLAGLPASTLVHPGHGPDTTIGREARINPFWPRG